MSCEVEKGVETGDGRIERGLGSECLSEIKIKNESGSNQTVVI